MWSENITIHKLPLPVKENFNDILACLVLNLQPNLQLDSTFYIPVPFI